MEATTYAIEADIVERHWWFRVRRGLFGRILLRHQPNRDAAVIDVGTSSGTNLLLLKQLEYRKVTGVDSSPESQAICARKQLAPVVIGDATALPFPDSSVDFVFATDVLEHLDDDRSAVAEIHRVLKPGGVALVTVPALQILWGLQDKVSHHRRRYRLGQLRGLLAGAGFSIEQSYYFNFLLFVPILAARMLYRAGGLKGVKSETELNHPALDWLLGAVFTLDTWLAPWLHAPVGVSALAVVRKGEK